MENHGNRAKGKRWQSVIARRLEALQAMEKVADALITEALTGNIAAIKEIGDRIDGKSVQGVEVSTPDGIEITKIERHIVDQAEPAKLVHSAD
jgi:hypothetical protein